MPCHLGLISLIGERLRNQKKKQRIRNHFVEETEVCQEGSPGNISNQEMNIRRLLILVFFVSFVVVPHVIPPPSKAFLNKPILSSTGPSISTCPVVAVAFAFILRFLNYNSLYTLHIWK